jgi:hypothetical protein
MQIQKHHRQRVGSITRHVSVRAADGDVMSLYADDVRACE